MKKATITAKGASTKQWADLILELNLIKKAWRRYGVTLDIQTPGIKKIITLENVFFKNQYSEF